MKYAIVGTSKLTGEEQNRAIFIIEALKNDFGKFEFVTGDALGVDGLVRMVIPRDRLTVVEAKSKNWDAFKERNIKIANMADLVVCITTKTRNQRCYHCDADHQRTGGCWTMQYARGLGKDIQLIIV